MILFRYCVMFFYQKRSFPAKTAVMVYILSLRWLKISTLVANSCISRVPPLICIVSWFFFMKQARREDIHTHKNKFFISLQSTFFELQYFS